MSITLLEGLSGLRVYVGEDKVLTPAKTKSPDAGANCESGDCRGDCFKSIQSCTRLVFARYLLFLLVEGS